MNKASLRFKACKDKGRLEPRIEDAIAVIQCGIEGIGGPLGLASGPVKIGEQEAAHASPIAFCSTTFGSQELQPDLVACLAGKSLGSQESVTNFADDALYFLEAVGIAFASILGHSPQQVDLVFQFATDKSVSKGRSTLVGLGLQLGTARLDVPVTPREYRVPYERPSPFTKWIGIPFSLQTRTTSLVTATPFEAMSTCSSMTSGTSCSFSFSRMTRRRP